MKRLLMLIICLCFALGGLAGAIPTTDAVSSVTAGTATLNGHGGASDCWFAFGGSEDNLIYHTFNDTSCSGTYTITGSPLLTSSTYYVEFCDLTGCGAAVSFTTSAATVSNRTTFGDGLLVIFRSGFNVTQSAPEILEPYFGALTPPITWGLLFFAIFVGLWVRQKDIVNPMILAFVAGGAIWAGTSALGIPPEWADIGMGLMYAAFAGMIFSWFTR